MRTLIFRQSLFVSSSFLAGPRRPTLLRYVAVALVAATLCTGCGTTRITDTRRTATEQLLMSGAIDHAVDDIDCQPLAGKSIFFDVEYYRPTEDQQYLVDTVRQKLLASGCTLKDKKSDADLVINLRVGVMGTDSNRLIFGVPSVNVPPALAALSSSPAIPSIPEVPLVTKQAQRGVAKIGLFAYDQKTGHAIWQSGAIPTSSTASEVWLLGAGPWQWGTIYDQPKFAGGNLPLAGLFRGRGPRDVEEDVPITVASTAVFDQAPDDLPNVEQGSGKIQLAGHAEPAKSAAADKPADSPPAPKPPPKPAATPPPKPPATAPTQPAPPQKPEPKASPVVEKEPAPLPAAAAGAAKLQPAPPEDKPSESKAKSETAAPTTPTASSDTK